MINRTISIENAKLAFKNFSGKEGKFNPAGRRNFCVILEPDFAKELESDGWNVRWLTPKDPDEPKVGYLQVAVNFSNIPPKIIMITSQNKTSLKEDTVQILDWAEIETVDLIIRPYNWEMNGKSGVKAYIKSMYVTIVEDEFEAKYRDVPDTGIPYLDEEDDV